MREPAIDLKWGIPLLQYCSMTEDKSKSDGTTTGKPRLFCYPSEEHKKEVRVEKRGLMTESVEGKEEMYRLRRLGEISEHHHDSGHGRLSQEK